MSQTIKSSTQDHLNLEDILYDTIFMKDGTASMVLSVNAVNFGLLSEEEQDAIIYAYAALLNSLTFPIQILIRSQRKDISHYVALLENQEKNTQNPIMRQRISSYRQFVIRTVQERNVLDKKFYVVVPFTRTDLGVTEPLSAAFSVKKKTTQRTSLEKDYIMQKALNTLEPRRDHLLRQFSRIGLLSRQLRSQQLIQLLYNIYNPDAVEGVQNLDVKQFTSAIMQGQ